MLSSNSAIYKPGPYWAVESSWDYSTPRWPSLPRKPSLEQRVFRDYFSHAPSIQEALLSVVSLPIAASKSAKARKGAETPKMKVVSHILLTFVFYFFVSKCLGPPKDGLTLMAPS